MSGESLPKGAKEWIQPRRIYQHPGDEMMKALWCSLLLSSTMSVAAAARPENVVLVTWDGVRPVDFFNRKLLPRLWARHATEGLVLGGGNAPTLEVANSRLMSLPGYQSIFTGTVTVCADNACGRVHEETFAERL